MMEYLDEIVLKLTDNFRIQKIILFGSRATDKYRDDSDYDICIIIDETESEDSLYKFIAELIIEHGMLIHPYIYSKSDYELHSKKDIFQKNVLRNNILLYDRISSKT